MDYKAEVDRIFRKAHLPRSCLCENPVTIDYLWSEYASSLRILNYDDFRHPSFEQYARGVMASPLAPDFITKDPTLLKRFPLRHLPGLGSGLCWIPAKSPP